MVIYAIKAVLKACISSNFVAEAESITVTTYVRTIARYYKENSQCKITPV